MGDLSSTPSTYLSETQKGIDMCSSETSKTLESKPEEGCREPKSLETQTPVKDSDPPSIEENEPLQGRQQINIEEGDEEGEDEEEEEGECGFCLYMKGGGCKDNFIAWEKCIEEVEKNKEDIVEKCFEAEKAAEEEVAKELEKEKEAASLPLSQGPSE
ncbi:hypothetical protein F0562_032929 [Nyssa sinensis]|uniref:GCK domain-containing protein n=1 Tax=Nyssa sinensis TaxID=561372 RepID=A0A5J5ARF6_9ASTE|nr:hypothetical protein F0562_032929 [Nyssa sinensis]